MGLVAQDAMERFSSNGFNSPKMLWRDSPLMGLIAQDAMKRFSSDGFNSPRFYEEILL